MSPMRPRLRAAAIIPAMIDVAAAPAAELPMEDDRLGWLILRVDQNTGGGPAFCRTPVEGKVIADEKANRMRIILPVAQAGGFATLSAPPARSADSSLATPTTER